jgi:SAM-dependent methyltransferase
MFNEDRLAAGELQVEKIMELVEVKGKRVLDLCCGPGRHAIPFAKRGFEVTAVDASEFLLAKAKASAVEELAEVEWVREDMRDFVRPGAYDLAISFFTSFGYFDDQDQDLKVLGNIHESLKPGGYLLLDTMSKELLAMNFQDTTSQRLPDGGTLIQRHEVFDSWCRARNEWTVISEGRVETFLFDLTLYSARELRERLGSAGFSSIVIYGDLDGRDYDIEAKRLIAVAEKGE